MVFETKVPLNTHNFQDPGNPVKRCRIFYDGGDIKSFKETNEE